jgi:hypothetical protein
VEDEALGESRVIEGRGGKAGLAHEEYSGKESGGWHDVQLISGLLKRRLSCAAAIPTIALRL